MDIGGSGAGARETALAESAVAWFSAVRFNVLVEIMTDIPSDSDDCCSFTSCDTDKDLDETKDYLDGFKHGLYQ